MQTEVELLRSSEVIRAIVYPDLRKLGRGYYLYHTFRCDGMTNISTPLPPPAGEMQKLPLFEEKMQIPEKNCIF